MNGYKAFAHGNRTADIYAETAYAAQLKAIELFKPPKSKRHMVHVHLCEKDGEQVTHSTASVG